MGSLDPPSAEVDITVFISCYNEEAYITDTFSHVIEALQLTQCTYEIIVIDDASEDRSVGKIRDFIARHPAEPILVKVNEINCGLGRAFLNGAFLGRGRYYRLCCGDDCESVDLLVNVFRRIGAADIVIPWQKQDEVVGKTPGRRLLSKLFTFLVNAISGYRLRYYNGMAIHLRSNVIKWRPASFGFGFQADLITALLDTGATYAQFPSSTVDRKRKSTMAIGIRNILSVLRTLSVIALRRFLRVVRRRAAPNPMEIFTDK